MSVRDDSDTVLFEPGKDLLRQTTHLKLEKRAQALGDESQLASRAQAIRREHRRIGLELLLKARDANHEELVEVRREDGQKLEPFKQRL